MTVTKFLDRFSSAVLAAGTVFLVGSLFLYGVHHSIVVPSDSEAEQIREDITKVLENSSNCRVEGVYPLSKKIGENKWTTAYMVQQLLINGELMVDKETGAVYKTPCFKTVEP